MTRKISFISPLNYQRNDRGQISNTIPLGCKANPKLCPVLKEKITALLLSKR